MKPKQNKTKLASVTYLRSSPPAMTIHSEYPLGLKAASIASPCSWPCVSTGWQYSLITSLIRGSPMAWWDTTVAHSEVSSKLILHLYVYSRLSKPQLSHIKVVISSSSRTGMSLKAFQESFHGEWLRVRITGSHTAKLSMSAGGGDVPGEAEGDKVCVF